MDADQIAVLVHRVADERGAHTAILYGSWARGDATEESDVDVLLVRESGTLFRDARLIDGMTIRGVFPLVIAGIASTACGSAVDDVPASPVQPPTARPATATASAPPSGLPTLVDPGFESFALARGPIFGWFSDDAVSPDHTRFARVAMLPDIAEHTEGTTSLRIEQTEPRQPKDGRAFLCQAVSLPDAEQNLRRFQVSFASRGDASLPLSVQIYVWDEAWVAQIVREADVSVGKEWSRAHLELDVPIGHAEFGIWIYLPTERGVRIWLDDFRLEPGSA